MLITKRDKVLLKKAQKIFGSIVKNAYIAIEGYEGESKEGRKERLRQYKFKDDNKEGIDYDRIVLVFANNKAIEFSTSEDAWMLPAKITEEEDL